MQWQEVNSLLEDEIGRMRYTVPLITPLRAGLATDTFVQGTTDQEPIDSQGEPSDSG